MYNKITQDQKDAIMSGNVRVLKEVLTVWNENSKEFLTKCSEDKFKETQGKCQTLSFIINLLP